MKLDDNPLHYESNNSNSKTTPIALVFLLLDLTLSGRRTLLYRNQSIYLLYKLMDWFLYDRDLRHERVKLFFNCNGTRTGNHLAHKWTLNHLAKCFIVRLQTKWLCVRVPFQPLNFQISRPLIARGSLTFRQLQSVDSF